VGTVTTGWVSVANFQALVASIQTGALGTSATLDAKLQQALDSAGSRILRDLIRQTLLSRPFENIGCTCKRRTF